MESSLLEEIKNEYDEIDKRNKMLINLIKDYSISQKENWQKIPYLALMADGRTGYGSYHSTAYYHGYWTIFTDPKFFVDLANGELVDLGWNFNESEEADDQKILDPDFSISYLDTKEIIKDLKEQSLCSYSNCYDPKKQEQWRNKIISLLDLKKPYERKPWSDEAADYIYSIGSYDPF